VCNQIQYNKGINISTNARNPPTLPRSYKSNTMPFFQFMSSRAQTNAEIECDTNMAQTKEGYNHALVLYKTPPSSPSKRPASPSQRPETPDNDSSITPFTPSKRQYREIDESISLREKNRALMATNEMLIEQQAILTQRANEASQMAREAEESVRAARDAMQLAQAEFEEKMTEKCQLYFARLMVSCIRQ